MRVVALALVVAVLAGCQSAQQSSTGMFDEAHALFTSLRENMQTCWFSGDPSFASYIYTPEINTGTPRILIVPKNEPTSRPLLVVEAKGRTTADVYGPLLATPIGGRVNADLGRWIKGGSGCA